MKKIALIILLLTSSIIAKDGGINFKINPLLLAFGVLDVEGDYRLNDGSTVSLAYQNGDISLGNSSYTITSYGIKSTYYLNGIKEDGYYLKPSYKIYTSQLTLFNNSYEAKNESAYGLTVGHHWDWFDFINFNMGAGYIYTTNQDFTAIPLITGFIFDFNFGLDF